MFKRKVPQIYNYTCCISEMRIDATINISMIDACHIIPFAESYNDSVTNGIALCSNLHRAFDRGLIGIDDNYKVIVKSSWNEVMMSYSIKQFEGKPISLPLKNKEFPSGENFKSHRIRFNF